MSGDIDEMINHLLNESSKLEQKEYNWVGKVIHKKLS